MKVAVRLLLLIFVALLASRSAADDADELDVLSEEDAVEAGITDGKPISERERMEQAAEKQGARPGIDKVLTVEDLMSQMAGGGAPPAPEKKPPVPWKDITGSVTVVEPTNESAVEGSVVDVKLNINTNTEETNKFEAKFNESSMCLSLDGSAFSCWPVFRLSKYPRFSNVQPGEHRLVAMLTDPSSGELIEESKGEMAFTTVPKNKTKEDELARDREKEQEKNKNATNTTDSEPETVKIPSVDIDFPVEGSAVADSFEARLSILTTENITKFKRLFGNGYMCLSLDEAAHTCWPIFEERYFPKLVGLSPGMHRLTAEVSHPENGDIIIGSGIGMRRFWVREKDTPGLVTMKLSPVGDDAGSTAIPGSIKSSSDDDFHYPSHKAQVVVQITVDGSDHSLPIYEGDDWTMEAARFCRATNIKTDDCVDTITAAIKKEWEAKESKVEMKSEYADFDEN